MLSYLSLTKNLVLTYDAFIKVLHFSLFSLFFFLCVKKIE